MIETGSLMRNKGSPKEAIVKFEMDFLDEGRIHDLMGLQDTIIQGLPDPEIFWTHPINYFEEIFKVERSVIGVSTEDGLIAYSLIYIPEEFGSQDGRENLGREIDLSKEDLKRVAHLQSTVVHPAYRGNSLQRKMARQHLDVLKDLSYEHILCTVSPKNPMSLRNILKSGFVIRGLKKKFNGWWRYILYNNILCSHSFSSDEVNIDRSDITGQIDLICKGYIGSRIELFSGSFNVVYCRSQSPGE